MKNRRAFTLFLSTVLVMVAGTAAFARGGPKTTTTTKGVSLNALFSTDHISPMYGVRDDGNYLYEDGIYGVQCYLGVSGKDLDLVTYNTNPSRTLHFVFDTTQTAWQAAGIPSDFYAVSDAYGINYYGRYDYQRVGTTAQVAASVEFYVGRVTYELNYQSLASYRESPTTWLITSKPNDAVWGYPGFTPSDQAALAVVRRKGNQTYGTVNMPIRFEITLK
jgi:hypothetical protein